MNIRRNQKSTVLVVIILVLSEQCCYGRSISKRQISTDATNPVQTNSNPAKGGLEGLQQIFQTAVGALQGLIRFKMQLLSPILNKASKGKKTNKTSMIPSARLTVPSVAIIIFKRCLFYFAIF